MTYDPSAAVAELAGSHVDSSPAMEVNISWVLAALLAAHAAGKREAWGKAVETLGSSHAKMAELHADNESAGFSLGAFDREFAVKALANTMAGVEVLLRNAARADGCELG